MDVLDCLRYMMKESGTSAVALSRAIGRSKNFIGTTFSKGSDVRASSLARMANAMGWRIVAKRGDVEVEITPRP